MENGFIKQREEEIKLKLKLKFKPHLSKINLFIWIKLFSDYNFFSLLK